jgi:hypothetical protein
MRSGAAARRRAGPSLAIPGRPRSITRYDRQPLGGSDGGAAGRGEGAVDPAPGGPAARPPPVRPARGPAGGSARAAGAAGRAGRRAGARGGTGRARAGHALLRPGTARSLLRGGAGGGHPVPPGAAGGGSVHPARQRDRRPGRAALRRDGRRRHRHDGDPGGRGARRRCARGAGAPAGRADRHGAPGPGPRGAAADHPARRALRAPGNRRHRPDRTAGERRLPPGLHGAGGGSGHLDAGPADPEARADLLEPPDRRPCWPSRAPSAW